MIRIKIKDNGISIKGHAEYADIGKDIVCAAVSILVTTFLNVCETVIVKDEPGDMEVRWKEGTDTDFLFTGLFLISNIYPDNVKIEQ